MHNGIRKAKVLRPFAVGGAAKLLFLVDRIIKIVMLVCEQSA